MEKRFKYRLDRRSKRITRGIALLVMIVFVVLHFLWEGNYFPAWFIAIALGLIALVVLSIPRYLIVNDDFVDIRCVVELTRIPVENIEEIRRVHDTKFKDLTLLIGSYGFGGFFGYYFNVGEWSMYKVYLSERKNLVLMKDLYENTFLVSCAEPEEFVTLVTEARDRKREEIFRAAREHRPRGEAYMDFD